MAQVVVRLDEDLAAAIDALIQDGGAANRSDAVRRGLLRLVDEHRRAAIGRAIVAGYRRVPAEDDDAGWSDAATIAMIAEEPW